MTSTTKTRGATALSRMLGLAAGVAGALAAAPAAAQPSDIVARAEAILAAAYPADGPGAAVIVTRGGRTLYAGGRGLADVERRTPITPDSVFRYASITKQFTAATVLRLVERGRISLDDPISRFFPDFPQPGGSATVRQLLNHTAGIRDYTEDPEWMVEANTNRRYSTSEMIALFRDLPGRTRPGQAWDYSNSGYIMLGAIIERVTGRPWYREVERMTRSLGLRTVRYGSPETEPSMVRGYTLADGSVRPALRIDPSVPHAAGGLIGSVRDLARWARALHTGQVLSPAHYTAMTSPTALPGGRTAPYGFGIRFEQARELPTIGHGGAIFGFQTASLYIPSQDVFVAVLANSDGPATPPATVARRLAALAIGRPYREFARAEVDPQALAPLFGVYRIGEAGEAGAARRFFARDGRLFTARGDAGAEREVIPAGNDEFFYADSFTWFRVQRRPGGAHVMEVHQNGAEEAELSVRTGDIPADAPTVAVRREILATYVGHYETQGPAADVALGPDGVLTIQLQGQEPVPLRARSETEFVIERVGATIAFYAEGGQVNRFVIRQSGRELEGRRTAPMP
jgi:D-alanyl-D-alanine carboxypeptidase